MFSTQLVRTVVLALAACVAAGFAGKADAVPTTWTGVGNWTENPANWSAGVPTALDAAILSSGSVTIDSTSVSFTPQAATLDVNGAFLGISDQTLTIGGLTRIGQSGVATVNQTGGAVSIGGNFDMNNGGSGTGSVYTVSGGTFTMTGSGNFTIGRTATFNHSAASNTMVVPGNMHIGNVGAGTGTFNLNAGTLQVGGNITLGLNGHLNAQLNLAPGANLQLTGLGSNFVMTNSSAFTNPSGHTLVVPNNLTVGNNSGSGASIFTQQGSVTVGNDFLLANDGSGHVYDLNGGTLSFAGGTSSDLRIGRSGTFNHNIAGTTTVPGVLHIGSIGAGTATFNLNSGTLEVGTSVTLGLNGHVNAQLLIAPGASLQLTGATADFIMTNSSQFTNPAGHILTVPRNLTVGNSSGAGASVFTQLDNVVVGNDFMLANDGSGHIYNLNAGVLSFAGGTASDLRIGRSGTFNHNIAGTTFVPGNLHVGSIGAGSGTFNLNSGTVQVDGNVTLGVNGHVNATMNIAPGASLELTGATSDFLMSNSSQFTNPAGHTLIVPRNMTIGNSAGAGASTFTQLGNVTIAGDLLVANADAGHAYNLNAGTLTFTGGTNSDLRIGRTGSFNHNANVTTVVPGIVHVGSIGAGNAQMNVNAGLIQVAGNVTVGLSTSNSGTLNIDAGGALQITGPTNDLILTTNATVNSAGQLLLPDALLIGTVAGTSTFTQTGGLVQVGGNVQLATVGGAIASYNLNGGMLNVLGTLDLFGNAGTDSFNLAGGTLSATVVDNQDGLLNFSSGSLSPGLMGNAATMTINGNLTMSSASNLQFDLSAKETFGGPNDLLVVNGNLTLDGTISLNELAGFTNGVYPLIQFTGTLTDLGLETAFATRSIFVVLNQGGGGTVFLAAIPEPSTAMLLMFGMVALRRRRPVAPRAV